MHIGKQSNPACANHESLTLGMAKQWYNNRGQMMIENRVVQLSLYDSYLEPKIISVCEKAYPIKQLRVLKVLFHDKDKIHLVQCFHSDTNMFRS